MDTLEVTYESVDISTEQDAKIPFLRHVKVLELGSVHTVVVTDFSNKCLKSFYTRKNKTSHSRLQLNEPPWDIAELGDNRVMVPVADSNEIVTVEVTPDLFIVDTITTRKKYRSLVVMSTSRLAAGGYDSVDILNMQGEVLKSVTTHKNVELFRDSDFLAVSNTGRILVSDWREGTVTCLTPEGEVVWIYLCDSGAGKPRGVTTTDGGDILVAAYKLKKVIQLSDSGEYIRDVLTEKDGIGNLDDFCVDKHGTFYICQKNELLKFVNL